MTWRAELILLDSLHFHLFLFCRLQSAELQLKSEVASTRLRYEQQVKNLSGELNAMQVRHLEITVRIALTPLSLFSFLLQRQCERFKKDRDAFKQMLEVAQKKIGDLKANNTGRQSRGSMHSSDDDDKSKIAYLEQQVRELYPILIPANIKFFLLIRLVTWRIS